MEIISSQKTDERFEDYVKKRSKRSWIFSKKEDGLKGPLTKFFSEANLEEIVKVTNLEVECILLGRENCLGLYGKI